MITRNNYLTRRAVLGGSMAIFALPAMAAEEYRIYQFVDYYDKDRNAISILGRFPADKEDIDRALEIAGELAKIKDPFRIMEALSKCKDSGPKSGEKYNERWKKTFNPLISLFFHDIGCNAFAEDDCTPWCAATLSWCFLKAKKDTKLKYPASSQDFLGHGVPVDDKDLKEGDICILTLPGNKTRGHVGFWMAGSEEEGWVDILGANQRGILPTSCPARDTYQTSVCIQRYDINRGGFALSGFRRI